MPLRRFACLALASVAGLAMACSEQAPSALSAAAPDDVATYFDCLQDNALTIASAHRGGSFKGYPENALETFAYVVENGPALLEVDVNVTSDGVLILMHDDTLDRTTTGSGVMTETPYRDIAALRLVDPEGAETPYAAPTLREALIWSQGKAILQLDIKRAVDIDDVAKQLVELSMSDDVVIIAYTAGQARAFHRASPASPLSVTIETLDDLQELDGAGVPRDRMIAWTGLTAPNPELYERLAAENIPVIFGTLGGRDSIDSQIESAGDDSRYDAIADQGVQVIATDRPFDAYRALGSDQSAAVCGF